LTIALVQVPVRWKVSVFGWYVC